jgi:membrane-associated phospholipid phosphatase
MLFAVLTAAVMIHRTQEWDTAVMLWLGRHRRPWLTGFMEMLSIAGSGLLEFPFAILLLLGLVVKKRKVEAGWYAAAVLSGWLLYALAKLTVRRPRPHVISHLMHDAGWFSYPSGHAMLAPLVFGLGTIAWVAPWHSRLVRRGALLVSTLLALGVGFSRIYLGAHYPTDVIGGLLFGTAWSGVWLLRWIKREAVP